jgi:hypothetical protein
MPPTTVEDALAQLQTTEAELRKTQAQLNDAKIKEAEARRKALKDAKADDVNKELAEFADQQARENTIFRVAAEFGLQPKDLEGFDFQSPTEVRLKAENLALTKRYDQLMQDVSTQRNTLERLAQQVNERDETELGAQSSARSPLQQGPTSTEAAVSGGQPGPTDYDRAKDLGRTAKGRRRLLQAIYRDPTKAIPLTARE